MAFEFYGPVRQEWPGMFNDGRGKVRQAAGEALIRCEEIREASVIVTVDGKSGRRELYRMPILEKELMLPARRQTSG